MHDPPPIPDNRQSHTTQPVTVRLADITPRPLQWLWPDRIPLGKVTLLAGDAAVGKSLLALDIAARVSAGIPWPDRPEQPNKPGTVILLATEDDLADTVQPRLVSASADLERITAVTSVKRAPDTPLPKPLWRASLQPTINHLDLVIRNAGDCRLLVIDPVTTFLRQLHSPYETDTRAFMDPLAELAARHHIAILAVHQAKRTATGITWQKTIAKFATTAARTVCALVEDRRPTGPEDKHQRRFFLPVKSIVTAHIPPLACAIVRQPDHDAPTVQWGHEPAAITIDEALGRRPQTNDNSHAQIWLQDLLSQSPEPAADIFAQADEYGFGQKAMHRAYDALDCIRRRRGSGPGAVWIWALPGDEQRLAKLRLDPKTEMRLEQEEYFRT